MSGREKGQRDPPRPKRDDSSSRSKERGSASRVSRPGPIGSGELSPAPDPIVPRPIETKDTTIPIRAGAPLADRPDHASMTPRPACDWSTSQSVAPIEDIDPVSYEARLFITEKTPTRVQDLKKRPARPPSRDTTRPVRSPSAPSRMDTELSPRSELNSDMLVISALKQRGSLSKALLEHIAMFLNDRSGELDKEETSTAAGTRRSPTTPIATRRPRSSDESADDANSAARKRPCTTPLPATPGPSRDPRLRSREVPYPPLLHTATAAGPSGIAPAGTPSFADILRPKTTTPVQLAPPPTTAAPLPTTTAPTSQPRFPPLIVESLPNWASHFKALSDKLGHSPNARPFGKGVRFTPSSINEYRVIQSYLTDLEKQERISWFSYALPSEVSKKVAIRGLPVTTTPGEITEALHDLGFNAEYVRPIKARMGRPGCIFFAIIGNTSNFPDIYNVSELLYMPGVKVEAWRSKKGPAQCHRCQAFRHSSHGCHRKQACVRCGEEHAARDCPRPREEAATCANCKGAHPANYTQCPQYKRELRNKKAGTIPLTKQPRTKENNSLPRPTVNTVEADAHTSNLMAPANPPTARGRRKSRGKRGRGQGDTRPPAPSAKDTAAITRNATNEAALLKPQTVNKPTGPKMITVDRAIDTLKDVLTALREGQDPVAVVMTMMTTLLQNE